MLKGQLNGIDCSYTIHSIALVSAIVFLHLTLSTYTFLHHKLGSQYIEHDTSQTGSHSFFNGIWMLHNASEPVEK